MKVALKRLTYNEQFCSRKKHREHRRKIQIQTIADDLTETTVLKDRFQSSSDDPADTSHVPIDHSISEQRMARDRFLLTVLPMSLFKQCSMLRKAG